MDSDLADVADVADVDGVAVGVGGDDAVTFVDEFEAYGDAAALGVDAGRQWHV